MFLESFQVLANLKYIGGNFNCDPNRRLWNSSTKNLKYVGGSLKIKDAGQMKNLNELSNLTFMGKDVYIFHNDSLSNVSGLDNLAYQDVSKLEFKSNLSSEVSTTRCFL